MLINVQTVYGGGAMQNDDKPQSEKFKDAARESGADESEDNFKARLRKVAKAKVKEENQPDDEQKDASQ